MSVQTDTAVRLAGEYVVVRQGFGQGLDYYVQVIGPDGRSSDQKVYWTYSKTPYQVAEEAVAGHLGQGTAVLRAAATREAQDGGFVVTVADVEVG